MQGTTGKGVSHVEAITMCLIENNVLSRKPIEDEDNNVLQEKSVGYVILLRMSKFPERFDMTASSSFPQLRENTVRYLLRATRRRE